MKITPILLVLLSVSSFSSYANTGSACGAFVKGIEFSPDVYRYHLVDSKGHNIAGSNQNSFSSDVNPVSKIMTMAYLLNKGVCVDWTYYADKWDIHWIRIEER